VTLKVVLSNRLNDDWNADRWFVRLGIVGRNLSGNSQCLRATRIAVLNTQLMTLSYHTPNGWITGFRWVPLGDRHVPSAGSQPANPVSI